MRVEVVFQWISAEIKELV